MFAFAGIPDHSSDFRLRLIKHVNNSRQELCLAPYRPHELVGEWEAIPGSQFRQCRGPVSAVRVDMTDTLQIEKSAKDAEASGGASYCFAPSSLKLLATILSGPPCSGRCSFIASSVSVALVSVVSSIFMS